MKFCNDERTVWLVRHGESTWNASGLVQGQADGPVLSAVGRQQAENVADVVRHLPVDTMVVSDLARARETAAVIGPRLGIDWAYDPALRERNFGAAEGTALDALRSEWSGIEDGRVVDADAQPPGGESVRELHERVGGFFRALTQRTSAGDVLVVTHGGVIRVALAICDRVPVTRMTWGSVPNASLWSAGLHELCQPVLLPSS